MGCMCKNNKVTINIQTKNHHIDDTSSKETPLAETDTVFFDKIQPSSILSIMHFFLYKEIKEIGKINRLFNSISRNPHLFKKFFVNSSVKLDNDREKGIQVKEPCIYNHYYQDTSNNVRITPVNHYNKEEEEIRAPTSKIIFPSFADYKMLSSGTNKIDMSMQSNVVKKQEEFTCNILTITGTKTTYTLGYNTQNNHTLNLSNSSYNPKRSLELSNPLTSIQNRSMAVMKIFS